MATSAMTDRSTTPARIRSFSLASRRCARCERSRSSASWWPLWGGCYAVSDGSGSCVNPLVPSCELHQFEPQDADQPGPEAEDEVRRVKRCEVKQSLCERDHKNHREEDAGAEHDPAQRGVGDTQHRKDGACPRPVDEDDDDGSHDQGRERQCAGGVRGMVGPSEQEDPQADHESADPLHHGDSDGPRREQPLIRSPGRPVHHVGLGILGLEDEEHEGSMISSRNTIWTGSRRRGQSAKKTGSIDRPAMGTCTARMKAIAFLILSKMRRPRRMAATMDEKSSSSSTRAADSRATSVPRPPMAMPMCAAFSAGASLTPSPVMATTSLFAFNAVTMRSFCSGTTRAKTCTSRIRRARSSSDIRSSSGPEMTVSQFASPAWRAMLWAVVG